MREETEIHVINVFPAPENVRQRYLGALTHLFTHLLHNHKHMVVLCFAPTRWHSMCIIKKCDILYPIVMCSCYTKQGSITVANCPCIGHCIRCQLWFKFPYFHGAWIDPWQSQAVNARKDSGRAVVLPYLAFAELLKQNEMNKLHCGRC